MLRLISKANQKTLSPLFTTYQVERGFFVQVRKPLSHLLAKVHADKPLSHLKVTAPLTMGARQVRPSSESSRKYTSQSPTVTAPLTRGARQVLSYFSESSYFYVLLYDRLPTSSLLN